MKKIILLTAFFQCAIFSAAFSMDHTIPPYKKERGDNINSIVINANVTVVLLNNSNGAVQLSGDDTFKNQLVVKQNGNKLVIDAAKNANLVNKGAIYISAGSLRQIQVNSAAYLTSDGPVEISRLDININGECKIHIIHIGELNLIGNDYYDYTQESKEILIPYHMLRSAKK